MADRKCLDCRRIVRCIAIDIRAWSYVELPDERKMSFFLRILDRSRLPSRSPVPSEIALDWHPLIIQGGYKLGGCKRIDDSRLSFGRNVSVPGYFAISRVIDGI
jgi:hypothetical protein